MKGIKSILGLMGVIFLCAGLVFMGVAVWQATGGVRLEEGAVQTEGTYLTVGRGNVTIGYEAGGEEWVIRSSVHSFDMDVGDPVTVWYTPDDPGNGRIISWASWGVFLINGSVFSLVGLGFLIGLLVSRMKRSSLLETGTRVTAQVVSVDRIYAVRINGRNPYVIRAVLEHPQSHQQMTVKSRYLMQDPTDRIQNGQVTVLVDPMNEKRYYMETEQFD